jgi:hypothetical protein
MKMPRKPIAVAALVFWLIALAVTILDQFVGFIFLQAVIGLTIVSILLE